MMNCCSVDEMFAFVKDPLKAENAEIALHLMQCRKCRDMHYFIVKCMNDNSGPDYSEMVKTKETVKVIKDKVTLNYKFNDFINILQKEFSEIRTASIRLLDVLDKCMFPGFTMSYATAPTANKGRCGDAVFTFESLADISNKYYWKMQMQFPASISPMSMLKITVTDGIGKNIPSGDLLYLGKKMKIMNGRIAIPMKVFLDGIHHNSVSFVFADNYCSKGEMKFLR